MVPSRSPPPVNAGLVERLWSPARGRSATLRNMTMRDRSGNEIELLEWADLWADMDYRVVIEDRVDNVVLRTVWEGIDEAPSAMSFTGVCRDDGTFNTVSSAYTEDEARLHHQHAVELLRALSFKADMLCRVREGVAKASAPSP